MDRDELDDLIAHQSCGLPVWDLVDGVEPVEARRLTHFCAEDRVIWKSREYAGEHIVADKDLYYRIKTGSQLATVVGRFWDSATRIVIPEFIKVGERIYTVADIAEEAFDMRRGQATVTPLCHVTLPDTIRSIGHNAFRGNENTLENIDIPAGCVVSDTAFSL